MRMYSDYFGVRENAFAITPDPRYLFLSERHREAMAHLMFGTEEGGGFVQLTGEVGTGKTTVCRAFLEQLPESVDVALLLSPPDNAQELLLAIASELRLALPEREKSPGEMIALLNRHLLESHAAGRRTVVIIDEAQNILPEVLEQVRLLTNLETPTHKLLQVFLIGQPELRQKLQHPSLRQVAQRITARYHLEPLSLAETKGYICHRLAVAGCRQGLFSAAAIRQIHRHSQGIPRVINILCDHALIGAYATEAEEVDGAIVRHAVREWRGGEEGGFQWVFAPPRSAAATVTLTGVLLAAVAGFAIGVNTLPAGAVTETAGLGALLHSTEKPVPVNSSFPTGAMASPRLALLAGDTATGGVSPLQAMKSAAPVALQAMLERWEITETVPDRLSLCNRARHHGLQCLNDVGDWGALRRNNRPALLTLQPQQGKEAYLALVGIEGEQALVATSEGIIKLSLHELEPYWNGEFLVLWRPPLEGVTMIAHGASEAAIMWLDKALHRFDGQEVSSRTFDGHLNQRLRLFQRSRGLVADGIAGPLTLIQLNNLHTQQRVPLLLAANGNN